MRSKRAEASEIMVRALVGGGREVELRLWTVKCSFPVYELLLNSQLICLRKNVFESGVYDTYQLHHSQTAGMLIMLSVGLQEFGTSKKCLAQ
jgi:hypothetical protein